MPFDFKQFLDNYLFKVRTENLKKPCFHSAAQPETLSPLCRRWKQAGPVLLYRKISKALYLLQNTTSTLFTAFQK